MARAVDAFYAQFLSAGIAVQDLVLKLGMKSLFGEIALRSFHLEECSTIVRDCDEIHVGRVSMKVDPSTLIMTFEYDSLIGTQSVRFMSSYRRHTT